MMHDKRSGKYTVAWFKLAEFVTRREKERALGLYRLLFHSFEDKALAYQLQGDILFSFSDKDSIEAYENAARLYEINGKPLEASLIYEQLISISGENRGYLQKSLQLNKQINNLYKIYIISLKLASLYINNQDYNSLNILAESVEYDKYKLNFLEYVIKLLLKKYSKESKSTITALYGIIQHYLELFVRCCIEENKLHIIEKIKKDIVKYSENLFLLIDQIIDKEFENNDNRLAS